MRDLKNMLTTAEVARREPTEAAEVAKREPAEAAEEGADAKPEAAAVRPKKVANREAEQKAEERLWMKSFKCTVMEKKHLFMPRSLEWTQKAYPSSNARKECAHSNVQQSYVKVRVMIKTFHLRNRFSPYKYKMISFLLLDF